MESSMTVSTFVWVNGSAAAKTCRDMGFIVHTGRGIDRFFIQERENPFNPSADIHRIPRDLIKEVTIRGQVPTQIELGGYKAHRGAHMRVSAHMEMERKSQGFFTCEVKVPSKTHQTIDIRAPSLYFATHIFMLAKGGTIKPDSVYDEELMALFD